MKKPLLIFLISRFVFHCTLAQQGTIQLPATGQVTSYYPGDDGDLQMGIPISANRFTDNDDDSCTDALTGLVVPEKTNKEEFKVLPNYTMIWRCNFRKPILYVLIKVRLLI